MKISQKIIVSVGTYGLTTVVGFLGTLYLANILGPGPLGTFALGMMIIKWLEMTDLGSGSAMAKRISEREEEREFLAASLVVRSVLVVGATLLLILFRSQLNDYIGGQYAALVAVLFFFVSVYTFLAQGLLGINKAHIKNSTDTVERIFRVIFQAGLVIFGFQTLALYWGYLASTVLGSIVAGFIFVRSGIRPAMPKRRHFVSIYDFAKYIWLTRLRNRSFSWIDVFVLGYFVSNSSIGLYQVTWNVAMTFWLVSNAISSNLFPELSELSTRENTDRIQQLLNEGLTYAGVIPLPGLVGAILVGDGVLSLYGPEFVSASTVLVAVSLLALFKAYEQQVLTALNSLDHPEYSFRVNVLFLVANVGLNLLLIPTYDLLGAAVATMISVILSLVYSWYFLQSIVTVTVPFREIGKQGLAATGMGVAVLWMKQFVSVTDVVPLLSTVVAGAALYFGLLLGLSGKFRSLAVNLFRESVF